MARRIRVARVYERAEIAMRVLSLTVELASLGILSYLSVTYWYDHATNPIAYVGIAVALLTDVAELFTLSTLNCGGEHHPPENGHDRIPRGRPGDGTGQQAGSPPDAAYDNGWPQVRLAWVAFGDMTSAVLLFFSWIWIIARGMFWSCLVEIPSNNGSNAKDSMALSFATRTADTGLTNTTNSISNEDDFVFVYSNCGDIVSPDGVLQMLSWILPFVMAAIHLLAVIVYCSALQRRVFMRSR